MKDCTLNTLKGSAGGPGSGHSGVQAEAGAAGCPGLAFTLGFLFIRAGSAAGVRPAQNQHRPAVPRARPAVMVLRTLVMVPAASDLQQAPEQTARSQVLHFPFGRQQLAGGAVLPPGLRRAVRTSVVRTAKPASGPPAKLPRWCSPRAWGYPFALRGGPQTSLSSFSAGDGAATVGATSTCGACARFQATRQRAPQNLASFRVARASAPHCWHLNSNQYQRCRIAPMLALLTLNP